MRIRTIQGLKPLYALMIMVAGLLVFAVSLFPDTSLARRGGDDARGRHYGVVESRPAEGLHGEWVIGGRRITTSSETEFDQREGLLAIGTCAKVDLRGGRVHEIDSEPLRDCQ